MKLATLDDGSPDGALVVTDGIRYLDAAPFARNLRDALERWNEVEPALRRAATELDRGAIFPIARCRAPLPRTFEWLDGSAFLAHVVLVRKARGAEPPPRFREDPLLYQGGGGTMLGPRAPLRVIDPSFGLDFEAELGVVLRATEQGIDPTTALQRIACVVLLDDVTYRGLVPDELAKGFGFVQSKPPTAFAPFAVTPDELGAAFRDGRLHRSVTVRRNGELFGHVDAGEMHFSFGDLIAHAARTRPLPAGTIIGSGTIANDDPAAGSACIVERRMREQLDRGVIATPYLAAGETVTIDLVDDEERSIFGSIVHEVLA